jgi:hypothetical protein
VKLTKREREARAQIARTHPFVACVSCNLGWVYFVPRVGDYMCADRCPCWYAHQAKVNELVRRETHARHART